MPQKAGPALIVTRNLPPLVGGMERLIWHIVEAISESRAVHVVGPEGSAKLLPDGVTASEVPLKPMPLFLLRSAWAALLAALRLRPAFVLAGSGLTAPIAWLAARLCGARCVVYLHGLDIAIEHRLYRMLWRPFFSHFDLVLVNSRYTQSLAEQAGIAPERIKVLHPGVELPDLSRAEEKCQGFRQEHGFGDAPLMLYVGRINARKGLSVFCREILPRVLKSVPDARLVVIGDEPKNALSNTPGEWSRVEQALKKNGLGHAISFLGTQDDETLSAANFAADVMVFPVQKIPGDIEGFGMVAIEAAAHNLPTVAFAVGGVPDAVSEGISGKLIPSGSNEAFADAVISYLDKPKDLKSRPFAEKFSWVEFKKRLNTVINQGSHL
jgi:phosphatidylinositol alpha-1,6-mannosyltransferase